MPSTASSSVEVRLRGSGRRTAGSSEIVRVVEACLKHKRPVYIEMPHDMVDREIPTTGVPHVADRPSDAGALEAAVAETIELLGKAKKPVIYAGVELHRYGLADLALHGRASHEIEGQVADDRIEVAERLADLATLLQPIGKAQPGFLDDVLRARPVAHDPHRIFQQLVAIFPVEGERFRRLHQIPWQCEWFAI